MKEAEILRYFSTVCTDVVYIRFPGGRQENFRVKKRRDVCLNVKIARGGGAALVWNLLAVGPAQAAANMGCPALVC